MTRRLIVIRHAKAGDGLVDHDRPLSERGERDAAGIGKWLTAHDLVPAHSVVSTARRTRQTWELAAAVMPAPIPVEFDDRIYDNVIDDLLDVAHAAPASVETLALVGHNPASHELVMYLDGSRGASELGRRVRGFFPTSAVAVVEIGSEWAHLGRGDGTVAALVGPEDF